MAGYECPHCKQWVENRETHDCWTTTEAALTDDLSDDLRDAWERLRETAAEFGEQRIYASHHSIMFSRQVCYFFVTTCFARSHRAHFGSNAQRKSVSEPERLADASENVARLSCEDRRGNGHVDLHALRDLQAETTPRRVSVQSERRPIDRERRLEGSATLSRRRPLP